MAVLMKLKSMPEISRTSLSLFKHIGQASCQGSSILVTINVLVLALQGDLQSRQLPTQTECSDSLLFFHALAKSQTHFIQNAHFLKHLFLLLDLAIKIA